MPSAVLRQNSPAVILTLGLGIAIAIGTLMPPHTLPQAPGGDKWQHFIAFAAFAVPISLTRPKWAWVPVLIALALGGAIELIQPLVSRTRDIADFRADALGAGLGALVGLALAGGRELLRAR